MTLIRYLLVVSLMILPAFAQTVTIQGQVTDESGGVVPGAKLTIAGPVGLTEPVFSSFGATDRQFAGLDVVVGKIQADTF